jgi:hypothetical protein
MWAAWFFGTKYVLKNLLPNLPEGVFRLVPGGGVEPPRPEGRRILSSPISENTAFTGFVMTYQRIARNNDGVNTCAAFHRR